MKVWAVPPGGGNRGPPADGCTPKAAGSEKEEKERKASEGCNRPYGKDTPSGPTHHKNSPRGDGGLKVPSRSGQKGRRSTRSKIATGTGKKRVEGKPLNYYGRGNNEGRTLQRKEKV